MTHYLCRERCCLEFGQILKVNNEDFQIEGKIGDGAAGIVRKLRRVSDGRFFASKFLAPDSKYIDESAFEDVAERFRREGERGSKLEHPNLLKIHHYVENRDGSAFNLKKSESPKNPFIIMECLPGRTLEHYLKKLPDYQKGKLLITETNIHIALQIVDALEYLHQRKLVHRDVKPSNIFFTDRSKNDKYPTLKLGDFGIVKWGDFQSSLTTGGITVSAQKGLGTLKYMSPEQAIKPKDVTVKADIFSLGVTLFELFTGQILGSYHHVLELIMARLERGTVRSRLHLIGYNLLGGDEDIADLLLDMHLRGPSGRPTIEKIKGKLEWEKEQRGIMDE